jgi:uncharacterized membrane protein YdjX (TVP38/TMEM64 family)
MLKLPINEEQQLARNRRLVSTLSIIVIVALIFGLGWLIGRPLLDALRNKESFRTWIQAQGGMKYFIMCGLMIVQIIIAIIPGGPIEVAAGYAFGTWVGTLICVLGAALGSALVFWATRRYGMKLVKVLVTQEKMDSFKFLHDARRLNAATFVVFLIPGMPKDILTYLAGITPIKMSSFLLLTSIARFPSILLSSMGGHSLGNQDYFGALIILGAFIFLALGLSLAYHLRNKPKPTQAGPAEKTKDGQDV